MHEAEPEIIAPEFKPIENEIVVQPSDAELPLLELVQDKLVSLESVYRETLADTAVRREIDIITKNGTQLLEPEVPVRIERSRQESTRQDLPVDVITNPGNRELTLRELYVEEEVDRPVDQDSRVHNLRVEIVSPQDGHERSLLDLQVEVVAADQPEPEDVAQNTRVFVENEVAGLRSADEDAWAPAETYKLENDHYLQTLGDPKVWDSIAEELAQEAHDFLEDAYLVELPTDVDRPLVAIVDFDPTLPLLEEELQEPLIFAEAQPTQEALWQVDEVLGEVLESGEVFDTEFDGVDIEPEVLGEAEFAVIQPELISADQVADLDELVEAYEREVVWAYEELEVDVYDPVNPELEEIEAKELDEDEGFTAMIEAIMDDGVGAETVASIAATELGVEALPATVQPAEAIVEEVTNTQAEAKAETDSKHDEPITVDEFIYELQSFLAKPAEAVEVAIVEVQAEPTDIGDQLVEEYDQRVENTVEAFKKEIEASETATIVEDVINGLQTLQKPEEITVAVNTISDLMQVAHQVNEFTELSRDHLDAKETLMVITKELLEFLGIPYDDDTIEMFANYILQMNKTFGRIVDDEQKIYPDPGTHEIKKMDTHPITFTNSQKFWQQMPDELWVGHVSLRGILSVTY